MNHIQISIAAKEEQQNILISELSDFDAVGFEQTGEKLFAYFEEVNFKQKEVEPILQNYVYHLTTLPSQNWNIEWEKNFQPVIVDNFCSIRAHFHEANISVAHEIIITPKMSFGTGHHATTYMMVQQMAHINFKNKKVLDFGTGTGILAILAKKLGASYIIAIDNDEWSIKNAAENFEKNNSQSIELKLTSEIPDGSYDIVLANINKNVLIENSQRLLNCLSKNSKLVLSGILKDDETAIVEAFNALQLKCHQQKENWVALLFEK